MSLPQFNKVILWLAPLRGDIVLFMFVYSIFKTKIMLSSTFEILHNLLFSAIQLFSARRGSSRHVLNVFVR